VQQRARRIDADRALIAEEPDDHEWRLARILVIIAAARDRRGDAGGILHRLGNSLCDRARVIQS